MPERRRGRFSGSEEQERQLAERRRLEEERKRQAQLQQQSRSEAEQQRQQQVQANRGRQSGFSCDSAQSKLAEALKRIKAKSDNSGISGKYCAAANIARAVTWTALRCLEDPALDAQMKEAMQGQIKLNQDNIRQNLKGFRALAASGASCGCWTDVCADGFDGDSASAVTTGQNYEGASPHVTVYDDSGSPTSAQPSGTRADSPEDRRYCPGPAACGHR